MSTASTLGSVPDALVEEKDDRSEGGFGLGTFRFDFFMSYSDPLWAGLGIIPAAQCSRDLCLVGTG